ncbi:MAG: hypothetical protein JXQ29_08315 [Planctomycetes bacterium]|nr:hypothetical protein [Planctomycetota bacterium]
MGLRRLLQGLLLVALLAGALAAQGFDAEGNALGSLPGMMDDPPGTMLLEFKLGPRIYGLTVVGDTFYAVAQPNVLEFDRQGSVKSTISLSGAPAGFSPFGLGYDHSRNSFILCDATFKGIVLADPSGKVSTFASYSPNRAVGAAYDSVRDGYWLTMLSPYQLLLYDAKNLPSVLMTIDLVAVGATRVAGAAYDPINDIVYTNSRDKKAGYAFSAATGALLYSWPLVHQGTNNGQGAAWWDRWQSAVVADYETFDVTFTETGYPRVKAADRVAIGTGLAITWTAANSPSKFYKAGASLTERIPGIRFGNRYFPMHLDNLFFLSIQTPAIFSRFEGVLDPGGTAMGSVNVPNVGALVGFQFSIAWVTVDSGAPFGIDAISGPWQVLVTK